MLKQLKLIHDLQLTDAERATYLSSLKRNAAQCMQVLIDRTLNVYKLDLESAEDVVRSPQARAAFKLTFLFFFFFSFAFAGNRRALNS